MDKAELVDIWHLTDDTAFTLQRLLSYQAKSKQAMKQVLGIRDEKTRMKVTPPLAVALITQEDDMRWNPNDDGIVSNP